MVPLGLAQATASIAWGVGPADTALTSLLKGVGQPSSDPPCCLGVSFAFFKMNFGALLCMYLLVGSVDW